MKELEEFSSDLANELGVPFQELPIKVTEKAAIDPLFLHHLISCKSEKIMLSILYKECDSNTEPLSNLFSNSDLLKSAVSSTIKWLSSGARFVSQEEYEDRINICMDCPNKSSPPSSPLYAILNSRYICGLCGCDIERKAKLTTEACPDTQHHEGGRWHKIS